MNKFPSLLDRLLNAQDDYRSIIVAVDFDDTVFDYSGDSNTGDYILGLLLRLKKLKARFILFTCREGLALEQAINYCKERGLIFNAINGNIPDVMPYHSRKPFYNVLLDDRAGLKETCEVIESFLKLKEPK